MWKYSMKVILQVSPAIIFVKFFYFQWLKWIHRANILEFWKGPLFKVVPQSQLWIKILEFWKVLPLPLPLVEMAPQSQPRIKILEFWKVLPLPLVEMAPQSQPLNQDSGVLESSSTSPSTG
jgi:hypothetical protein